MSKVGVPQILANRFYLRCIELALQSKNDKRQDQAFGAVLVKSGEIIGEGRNRAIVHPRFRLERIVRQGYVNHAEVEALNDALMQRRDVNGGLVYVAGFFMRNGFLFFQNKFTCKICISPLRKYLIEGIAVPTPNAWIERSLDEAEADARECNGSRYDHRQSVLIGNYSIGLAKEALAKR